jgi:hypothetical protein
MLGNRDQDMEMQTREEWGQVPRRVRSSVQFTLEQPADIQLSLIGQEPQLEFLLPRPPKYALQPHRLPTPLPLQPPPFRLLHPPHSRPHCPPPLLLAQLLPLLHRPILFRSLH